MPWQPKAGAPSSFNVAEALAALITGDANWGWLIGWLPLAPQDQMDTALFCAQGPIDTSAVDVSIFAPSRSRSRLNDVIDTIAKTNALRIMAYDRIFSAYCENLTLGSDWSTPNCFHTSWSGSGAQPPAEHVTSVPDGATQIRFTMNNRTGQSNIHLEVTDHNGLVFQTLVDQGANGAQHIWTYNCTGHTGLHYQVIWENWQGQPASCDICVDWYGPLPTSTDPLVPAEPDNFVPPTTRTYASIQELGDELDRQEFKLDRIITIVDFLASLAIVTPGPVTTDPIDVVADTPIDITDAAGIIITLTGIPPGADEQFQTPVKLHRVGRVTLGTPDGWLPSFELEHNPLVIMPIPLGVTRVQVSTRPPVASTVMIMPKPK